MASKVSAAQNDCDSALQEQSLMKQVLGKLQSQEARVSVLEREVSALKIQVAVQTVPNIEIGKAELRQKAIKKMQQVLKSDRNILRKDKSSSGNSSEDVNANDRWIQQVSQKNFNKGGREKFLDV